MSFFPLDLERDFEDEMRNMREDMKSSNKSHGKTENVSHQLKRLEQSLEDMKLAQSGNKDDKRLRLIESTLELTKKDVSNLGQSLQVCESSQNESNQKLVQIIEKEVQNESHHNSKIVHELKKDFEDKVSQSQLEFEKSHGKLGLEIKNLEAKVEKNLGSKLMSDLRKIETKLDGYLQQEDEKVKALEELVKSHETQAKLDSQRFSRDLESFRAQNNQEQQSRMIKEVKSDLEHYKMQNSQGLKANKEELERRVEKSVEATLESHMSKIKDDMNSKDAQLDLKQTKQVNEVVKQFSTELQTLEVKLESKYQNVKKETKIDLENQMEIIQKSIPKELEDLKSQISESFEAKLLSNLQNIESQVKQVCEECDKKIANASKASNETLNNVENKLGSSIKSLEEKTFEWERSRSDHQEKLKAIETQLKSKVEENKNYITELETKLESLKNSNSEQIQNQNELENKIENLQKSISGQINALKSEVYVKHKSFEAEVKAEQIDIQNMKSEMSNLSEKIKDLPEVKFLKKSLKNLEETLNKKNEQCKNSLETQFDGQLSRFSSSLEGKFETDAKKLQEDLEKKLSQSQDKMDVKLESQSRVQLQSLSSLEAKLDSKYAKVVKYESEKKTLLKEKEDFRNQLENLQNTLEVKLESTQNSMKIVENDLQRFENELQMNYEVLKNETIKDCGQLLESSLADAVHKLRGEIQMGHRRELEKSLQLQKEEVMRDIIELQKKIKEADLDRNIGNKSLKMNLNFHAKIINMNEARLLVVIVVIVVICVLRRRDKI